MCLLHFFGMLADAGTVGDIADQYDQLQTLAKSAGIEGNEELYDSPYWYPISTSLFYRIVISRVFCAHF
jgi:hypothetical protein